MREVDDADMEEGQEMLQRGLSIRRTGQARIAAGTAMRREAGVHPAGKAPIDAAVLGERKAQELRQQIHEGAALIAHGRELVSEVCFGRGFKFVSCTGAPSSSHVLFLQGDALVHAAYGKLPGIPSTTAVRCHYDSLGAPANALGSFTEAHAEKIAEVAISRAEARSDPASLSLDDNLQVSLRQETMHRKFSNLATTGVFRALSTLFADAYDFGFGSVGVKDEDSATTAGKQADSSKEPSGDDV